MKQLKIQVFVAFLRGFHAQVLLLLNLSIDTKLNVNSCSHRVALRIFLIQCMLESFQFIRQSLQRTESTYLTTKRGMLILQVKKRISKTETCKIAMIVLKRKQSMSKQGMFFVVHIMC